MASDFAMDRRLIRLSFEKAACGYDAAAVLQQEICRRMLSRLDYIRQEPTAILDAGCGTGGALPELRRRYPDATLIALDFALAMVRRAAVRAPWWQRAIGKGALPIGGDMERLPLRNAAIGMVWSSLALQWVNDPPRAFAEFRRVLAPGGLLMFSSFGPDTLKELRAAFQGVDPYTHVNRFVDMHDLGDMLLHAGFADPVMDMEYITLMYADLRALMRDLKAIGAHNVTTGRRRALTARATLEAAERNYEAARRDGRLPATFEVIYGHAWVPQPRVGPAGRPVIEIKPRR